MELVVQDLKFMLCGLGPSGDKRFTHITFTGLARFRQGELSLLIGPSGGGKSTLLRILGGEILPHCDHVEDESNKRQRNAGRLFIPSPLRVLHVGKPMFFADTLLANLTFGVAGGDVDGQSDRVKQICERLGASEEILGLLGSDDKHRWSDVFSSSQCQLMSLARAFVFNPEVLCIHQPTQLFNETYPVTYYASCGSTSRVQAS